MKLLILAGLSTLLAFPALAQQAPCKPLDQMEAWLAAEHQETKAGFGTTVDGMLTVLYRKQDGSSFTVVKVTPRKLACIVDIGMDWTDRQLRSDPAPVSEEGL